MSSQAFPEDTRPRVEIVKTWLQLSRPPFHLVGIFPFALGASLSWYMYGTFNWPIFIWSLTAIVLIMLTTYYGGEYHDIKEDRLSAEMERNRFSGGSQVLLREGLPGSHAKIAGHVTVALACAIGLILQFYYKTGPWTIPLGVAGIISGFFYSRPPLRWVKRGIGEVLIGFCYGWLPVAVGFYLQTGTIDSIVHLVSWPIACAIFNVILINEFPDYPADLIEGKKNLVVRFGRDASAFIYIAMMVISWIGFSLSMVFGVPLVTAFFYLPIFALSLTLVIFMLKKDYLDRKRLERICALTIAVNLGTSLAYIFGIYAGML